MTTTTVKDEAVRLLGNSRGLDGKSDAEIRAYTCAELLTEGVGKSQAYCDAAFAALSDANPALLQLGRRMRLQAADVAATKAATEAEATNYASMLDRGRAGRDVAHAAMTDSISSAWERTASGSGPAPMARATDRRIEPFRAVADGAGVADAHAAYEDRLRNAWRTNGGDEA